MSLKNRNISSKIKRSKVTEYAALMINCSRHLGQIIAASTMNKAADTCDIILSSIL